MQIFSINTEFIFILWYENYHISLVYCIFIFIPLNENEYFIYSKNLDILCYFLNSDSIIPNCNDLTSQKLITGP
jgi:hypothetical protein